MTGIEPADIGLTSRDPHQGESWAKGCRAQTALWTYAWHGHHARRRDMVLMVGQVGIEPTKDTG